LLQSLDPQKQAGAVQGSRFAVFPDPGGAHPLETRQHHRLKMRPALDQQHPRPLAVVMPGREMYQN